MIVWPSNFLYHDGGRPHHAARCGGVVETATVLRTTHARRTSRPSWELASASWGIARRELGASAAPPIAALGALRPVVWEYTQRNARRVDRRRLARALWRQWAHLRCILPDAACRVRVVRVWTLGEEKIGVDLGYIRIYVSHPCAQNIQCTLPIYVHYRGARWSMYCLRKNYLFRTHATCFLLTYPTSQFHWLSNPHSTVERTNPSQCAHEPRLSGVHSCGTRCDGDNRDNGDNGRDGISPSPSNRRLRCWYTRT